MLHLHTYPPSVVSLESGNKLIAEYNTAGPLPGALSALAYEYEIKLAKIRRSSVYLRDGVWGDPGLKLIELQDTFDEMSCRQ